MTPRQFYDWLETIGVDAPRSTIRRWISQGWTTTQHTGSKSATDYPLKAVGEVAVMWTLRETLGDMPSKEQVFNFFFVIEGQLEHPDSIEMSKQLWLSPIILSSKDSDKITGALSTGSLMLAMGSPEKHRALAQSICNYHKAITKTHLTKEIVNIQQIWFENERTTKLATLLKKVNRKEELQAVDSFYSRVFASKNHASKAKRQLENEGWKEIEVPTY